MAAMPCAPKNVRGYYFVSQQSIMLDGMGTHFFLLTPYVCQHVGLLMYPKDSSNYNHIKSCAQSQ